MNLCTTLKNLRTELPPGVSLIAVSKTQPPEVIREAVSCGQLIFGENKAQELIVKAPSLPGEIEWHFIGHLQRNKIRAILPFVSLIHSIDSFTLLQAVDKESALLGKTTSCLLQFHIATEETKFGLDLAEASAMLSSPAYKELRNIHIRGVMGMATYTDKTDTIRKEFHHLHTLFDYLKKNYFSEQDEFREISMGMSDDYRIAIEEGSTMVRIGTAIFGKFRDSAAGG